MALITESRLRTAFPKCKSPDAWVSALLPALDKYNISSKARVASFLGQIAHESGQFNTLEENLFYSASRLMKVWPKRFPTQGFAQQYEKNPTKLGNYVYANRIGNGAESSGDGYRFRGRGLIQLTGRSNYASASSVLGVDLLNNPDLLLDPNVAAMSAAWFWASRGLNELADDKTDDDDLEDFTTITKRINGGTAGLQERFQLFKAAEAALA
ncbi:glycoside hydrolase family 19 protein [Pseudomethylobacillus aquaticus]|uniref:Glycoside hydrolase family 19 protein n=1 Tax=Pseudomethylobacillus aquaticus TaxID=2676064 RepID=A0A3N0V0N6_9PROT|nr:glycoside hydrolase family 19 protein [Pseudomethylobacillus aquaticus]ROH86283.1 glycoside hydrolase family 19 protein [Pseudomethylobacillus aquaticus]